VHKSLVGVGISAPQRPLPKGRLECETEHMGGGVLSATSQMVVVVVVMVVVVVVFVWVEVVPYVDVVGLQMFISFRLVFAPTMHLFRFVDHPHGE
jgi:hypothetical protein